MGYFPFFVDIQGKSGLIVGGGRIAAHKAEKLLPFLPKLTITAPEIAQELMDNPLLDCQKRAFMDSDLEGKFFVIAASGSQELNRHVAELCREKKILVNVVDDKEACGFLFPSLVKEGRLTVGVSTEGASPQAAALVRSRIAQEIPGSMEEILDYLAGLRAYAREHITDPGRRAGFLKEAALLCMEKNRALGEEERESLCEEYQEVEGKRPGTVTLVGAGCGPWDLVTVRGLDAVRTAQVLVYDDLMDARLLSHASESCEKIYVGKRKGRHSMGQEEINGLLLQKAKEGKRVVRLKGGDPFVFGRGGEEILALREGGIETALIPGISSCVALPAAAGIPVTFRGLSRSFHVATAHTNREGGDMPEHLKDLAGLSGTLVFLMGFGRLKEIAERLIEYGKSPQLPAAVIRGNFGGTVRVVRGQLWEIARKAKEAGMEAPAVILVGETAGMDLGDGRRQEEEGVK
ncbi:siroheme synthase [Lachnospiraceae bacterium]|nr:siroheme synthase [Lachnospiraceae bacterium]